MTEGAPKPPPLGIALFRQFIADGLPKLHADAYIVATVIAELQDYCHGRAVGFWISQLADRCGMGCKNPRRLRAALKYLRDNGYLEMTIPPVGSRAQTMFKLALKTKNLDPRQTDGPIHETPTQVDGGKELTPVETVARPPSESYGDPRQNGSTSNPVLTNPVLSTPESKDPLPPPQGEEFRLTGSESGKRSKRVRTKAELGSATGEEIYQAYPLHVAKGKALGAITKVILSGKIQPGDLLAAVKEYAKAIQWKEKQFIPQCATWMNAERWTDDRATWQQPSTNGRKSLAGGAGQTFDPEAATKDPNYGKF